MNFKVIKTNFDGFILEDLGIMNENEVQNLAMSFIPEVFVSEEEVKAIMDVIKSEGSDDWFVSEPVCIINIRKVEE